MEPDHEIAIIGAGIGGLGIAAALLAHGFDDFVVLERADDVGGTWRDNVYPGVEVDVPTFAYQYSDDLRGDWTRMFATGADIKSYLDRFAHDRGILPHIRFAHDVGARSWDEDAHVWRLDVRGLGTTTARYLISAVGLFVAPKPPSIPGLDQFDGVVMQSQRWDHSYSLAGKRVAVIGTGASAVQIVPSIASRVAQLRVYQRTPIWVLPRPDTSISPRVRGVLERSQSLRRFAHAGTVAASDLLIGAVSFQYARFPFATHAIERLCRRRIARTVSDPAVARRLTPTYRFGCKRPSFSNDYLPAFNRPNVELVTEPIETVTPTGIATRDGRECEVDAIVLATGFRLFYDPENYRDTPVAGSDGFDLATHFEHERLRAYAGVAMQHLPNHFMLCGPYANVSGSYHRGIEASAAHIVRVISEARARRATRVEISSAAVARQHDALLSRLRPSVWRARDCSPANTYYLDHHGDAPILRPDLTLRLTKAAQNLPPGDYRFDTLP